MSLEYVGYWGTHAKYTLEDWKREVQNDDTRLGYWDWVEAREELAAVDEMMREDDK